MAITVVHSAETGGTATSSLTITSATASNTLCCMISQSASTSAPTLTGWTVEAASAVFNSSGSSLWFAHKTAAGGETSIAPTAGSGGTLQGICYWELNGVGAPFTMDPSIVAVNNGSAATGSATVSTASGGDIVLLGVGFSTGNNGGATAWTGSDVATGINTANTRCQGGSYIAASQLTSQAFTANWSTSRPFGMLAVAIFGTPAFSGTATGSLSILASASGAPAFTETATASLSIFAAATPIPFEGDMDAVPQIATFPFIPGQPESLASGTATGSLSISAGTVTGTPNPSGTANGFLSIAGLASPAPSTGITASLSIGATATGSPKITQSGATGSLTISGAPAAGSPATTQSGATGTLTIASTPIAPQAGGEGVLSISANTPVGSVSIPGILDAQLSILATVASTETNALGVLSITASAGLTSLGFSGTAHALLSVGTTAQSADFVGAQLSIGTYLYSGPIAPAFLTITASVSGGTVYVVPVPGTVGISVTNRYTVGIGVSL